MLQINLRVPDRSDEIKTGAHDQSKTLIISVEIRSHYGEKKVAPLRRKNTGAITPEIQWLLYAGNEMAPLRRKLTPDRELHV